jgi:hypothetical protein
VRRAKLYLKLLDEKASMMRMMFCLGCAVVSPDIELVRRSHLSAP